MAKIAAQRLDSHYRRARQAYSRLRVNADAAIQAALTVPISLPWRQAHDVGGYEVHEPGPAGGGIMATGRAVITGAVETRRPQPAGAWQRACERFQRLPV